MTNELVQRARTFARTVVLPRAGWLDGLPPPPTPVSTALHEAGLSNWWLPVDVGGAGGDLRTSVDVVSELAYADAGFAFGSFLPVLGTTMLQHFGDPALAAAYLGRLGRLGGTCGVVISEEEAGSELGRMSSTFRTRGDELVLDGDKYISTNSEAADFLLVAARDADDPATFTVILVPRDTPGLKVAERWDMIGMRGSASYRVQLRDCVVPAGHALRGHGLRVLETGLNASRILIAATAIGIARRIRDLALEYATTKQVKAQSLAENAVFAAKLGQLEIVVDVMRNQCLAAAEQFDQLTASGDPAALYRAGALRSALAAKAYCGQAGWDVATTGSQLFGGLGYTHDHPIGKLVRDMRYVSLVEGGDDVMRDLVYTRYVVPPARRR